MQSYLHQRSDKHSKQLILYIHFGVKIINLNVERDAERSNS
jgi:hypothetical protein